jgi:hypothetical protein
MGLFTFGAPDFKGTIAGMVKAGMLMQDIECPSLSLGGLNIRMIGHPHHKAFEMGMRGRLIVPNSTVKDLSNVINAVIPMGRHGQRVPDKKAPQGVLQALPGRDCVLFIWHLISPLMKYYRTAIMRIWKHFGQILNSYIFTFS